MGLKKLKEYYGIDRHDVQRQGEKILIGSSFVSNLIAITDEGRTVVRNPTFAGTGGFLDDLAAILKEDALRGVLAKILNAPDEYEQLHNVWTYDRGKVFMKECEVRGYPNVTTDGELMYDNTFFPTRDQALASCRRNDRCFLRNLDSRRYRFVVDLKDLFKYHGMALGQTIRSHLFRGI